MNRKINKARLFVISTLKKVVWVILYALIGVTSHKMNVRDFSEEVGFENRPARKQA